MSQKRLVILDGNAILHRAYHALPPLTTKDGVLVNAAFGFLSILFKVIKELQPTHLAATFDLPGPTFRHEEFKEYKAQRVKQPDEFYRQIPIVKEILAAARIPICVAPGFEADDVIGTLAKKMASAADFETIIVTGDMDALQLVDDKTKVFTMRKGLSDTVMYDEAAVVARFGFAPAHMIDYKALRGDASDNIPGVKGIGEKTALALVQKFGGVEKIYAALLDAQKSAGISERVKKILLTQKEVATQSLRLVTIVRDVPLEFKIKDAEFSGIERGAVFPLFQKYAFLSLLARLPGAEKAEKKVSKKSAVKKNNQKILVARDAASTRSLVGELLAETRVAIYFLKPIQQDLFGAGALTIGFAWGNKSAAVEVLNDAIWDELGRFFTDKKVVKAGHDLKQVAHDLAGHGIALGGDFFDVMIAAYVLQAGTRAHDLPSLVVTVLGEDVAAEEWIAGEPTRAARAAERVAWLAEKLLVEMEDKGLPKVFFELEMPLVAPLARMERWGIELDTKYLAKLQKKFSNNLEKISEKIYKLAGEEFNINSPQQVSEVLFAKMKISAAGLRRGKTRTSTAAGELEKLSGTHEIVDEILEHRELAKLLNTYVEALPKLVAADGRVHTSYNQAVTATGRLSSSNPNLQNIPTRTEIGKEIRRAFVAADGFELLSCDYSQIELRIVAHLAGDQRMLEIFRRGDDVHRATAAEIYGIPAEEVTKAQRASVKEINFGVMYGMGAWGLAERTGLSREAARDFIDKYFATFSGVAAYLEETREAARRLGYVETMFHRRRYLPEINSQVPALRAAAERMAVNMPVQGTQADIVKKALVAVDEFLCREFGGGFLLTAAERAADARLLLQVHDELILEVKSSLVKELAPQIVKIMSDVVQLDVPLNVDFAIGRTWADLE